MRKRSSGTGQGLFSLLALALGCIAGTAAASTSAPHEYYVLTPEPLSGPVSIMSLEPNNTITFGAHQITLQQYETASVPSATFTSGTKFSGTGFFVVDSGQDAADLLVPDDFAGTSFVIPHISGSHRYFFLSPSGPAQVTIRIGANTYNVTAGAGIVNEFDAGSVNSGAGRITSDVPIVVSHVAYASGAPRDALPVPPAANEIWGIRSQNVLLGAAADGTTVQVHASDGTSGSYSLNAGEQIAITTGAAGANGAGNALRIVANGPVGALQYDDGDGNDATAFWSSGSFSRRHGLPVNAQYLAVTCTDSNVTLTLYRGATLPEVKTCSGSATTPGKAYFGSTSAGAHLSAGWYLISSSAVYAMYEAAVSNDEHNLLGLTPAAGPAPPTLDAVSSPVTVNPQTVSGTSAANQTVRLYVNGLLQATTSANGSGAFAFPAALGDGANALYVTAVASGNESDPSNAISIEYNNTLPRTQGGAINSDTVWTPGNPAQPYVVTASLTVAAGSTLTLQPGTVVQFSGGTSLTANGALRISGTSTSPVLLTSTSSNPTYGSWTGIVVSSTGSATITNAVIEYAVHGVNANNAPLTLRNSTIRYVSGTGIALIGSGTSASLIQGNLFDNFSTWMASGFYLESTSPHIVGNTIRNFGNGMHIAGTAAPLVNGNNVITTNGTGFYVDGYGGNSPQPIFNDNQIHANHGNNYRVVSYPAGAANLKLDARRNWWGTTDPTQIAGKISDLTDNYDGPPLPTVDFGNYLSAPNGSPTPGNHLIGAFTAASTTLLAGTTYEVFGVAFVPAGKALIVPAGITLRFHGPLSGLRIIGTLNVEGSAGSPVVLTSGLAAPARGSWGAIDIPAGAGAAVIDHAVIEWPRYGVIIRGTNAIVRNSTVRNFTDSGIFVESNAGHAIELAGNSIDNLNDTGVCIEVYNSSPLIQGNTLTNCHRGIHAYRTSSPTITGNNVITGNNHGIELYGGGSNNPQPVVTGNQIHGNNTYNYYAFGFTSSGSSITLNARNNWWGSTNRTAIRAKLHDLYTNSADSTLPVIDWSSYLDGPNGSAVPGSYLIGALTVASTTLTAVTYDVLGPLLVPAGKELTIPAGATLRFHGPGAGLHVTGTLTVSGTAGTPVTFTSAQSSPTRGSWGAINIPSGAAGPVVIDGALIEWPSYGVIIRGTNAIVRNSTIRNFANSGIYVESSAGSAIQLTGNSIDNLNDTGVCIEVYNSSPLIQGNTLTNCHRGIHAYRTSSPTITGNNVITGNNHGIELYGGGSNNPQPVVTGNQIHGNNTYNYYAFGFTSSGSSITLNARNNWWGSTSTSVIRAKLYDLYTNSADSTLPVIDWGSYLDGPNGAAVPGNYLIGALAAASTALTAVTYDVLGPLLVLAGKELTIPAGATLRFHGPGAGLHAIGRLTVTGTAAAPVTFTSAQSSPTRGGWGAINIPSGAAGPVVIDGALIEWPSYGIIIRGTNAIVRNSTIRNFANSGIYVESSAGSAIQLTGNSIDNLNDTGKCIEAVNSSPLIQGNTLTNCHRGIHAYYTSSPTVNGNNIITGNRYGIEVYGAGLYTAAPVVTGNQIFGNQDYNYLVSEFSTAGSTLVLNARNNWWGSTDPQTIASSISDLSDNYTNARLPTVDWSGFLDGPAGSPVAGNQLIGPFPSASTTLTAGATYDVLGMIFVPAGRSLTVPAGAVLRFHGAQTRLVVDGALQIQGASSSRVRLTSSGESATKGAWYGVEVRPGATPVTIDYAEISGAVRGVSASGATVNITNSVVVTFSDAGIWMSNVGSSSSIAHNYIDNSDGTGYGISLSASSPAITGNQIYGTSVGIYASGASNAAITQNRIADNARGVVLDGNGSNSATAVPNPTLTSNDILNNTGAELEAYRYGGGNPLVIDATGNWWGTTTPQSGQEIHFTNGSPASVLNFSSWASAPVSVTGGYDGRVPTTPLDLSVVRSGTALYVEWAQSTDNVAVTGYLLERCQGAGCTDFSQIASTASAAFTDASVSGATTYRYRVRAVDNANNTSAYSTVASRSTPSGTALTCD